MSNLIHVAEEFKKQRQRIAEIRGLLAAADDRIRQATDITSSLPEDLQAQISAALPEAVEAAKAEVAAVAAELVDRIGAIERVLTDTDGAASDATPGQAGADAALEPIGVSDDAIADLDERIVQAEEATRFAGEGLVWAQNELAIQRRAIEIMLERAAMDRIEIFETAKAEVQTNG